MAIHLPGGIAQMLGKVLPKPEKAGAATPALPGAAVPAGPAGPLKGAPIGEAAAALVLHGAGYNGADRTGNTKNVHEKDTVARFLKEPDVEKMLGRSVKEVEEPRATKEAEAKDKAEAQKADVRKDERAEEQKVQGPREAQREEATRDQAQEREKERQREERKKDEQGQGNGSGDDPRDADEEERPRGAYDEDPLGESFRCKGEHDGVRCLRHPIEGTAYCREHIISETRQQMSWSNKQP